MTLPPLDDRTRFPASSAAGRAGQLESVAPGGVPESHGAPAAPSGAASRVDDLGELAIRDVSRAAAVNRPLQDLSVVGLAGSSWGRHVLAQGLALAFLVLVLTAAPLVTWEVRLYGSSVLSSWPVLLPVVLAAIAAGLAVASLIARTTARGLSSQDR
jgi:hypothetical protein